MTCPLCTVTKAACEGPSTSAGTKPPSRAHSEPGTLSRAWHEQRGKGPPGGGGRQPPPTPTPPRGCSPSRVPAGGARGAFPPRGHHRVTWLRVLPSGTRQHDPNMARPGCSSGTRKPPRPRGPQARAFGNRRTSVPTDGRASGHCFLSPLLYKHRVNFPEPQRTLTPGHRIFRLPPGRTPRGRPRRALAARHARPFMKTPAPREAFGNIHETASCPAAWADRTQAPRTADACQEK